MLTVTVFIFGAISWFRLEREFMPELQFPQLVVLTGYPNASSQEVENLVTKVVEESAGTVKNVRRIHSSSREGISIVTVEFLWGTNMDLASLNLREKVDLAKSKLPRDCGEPRIEKFDPFALPVITLSLSGSISDKDLLALARRPVSELLEKTRGVAAVSIAGGREREIQVELDQSKLTARGLSIRDVEQSVAHANIVYPAGTVKDDTFEYVVRVLGTFKAVKELGRVTIAMDRAMLSSGVSPLHARSQKQRDLSARRNPQPITLASLGNIHDAVAETASYSRYNGRPNISLSVLKQAEANIVRVAESVKEKLPEIQRKLPAGVTLKIVYDQSTFIQSGIRSMVKDGLLGGLLAFAVLFLFLGSWRDALVVSMAIPVSILATFFIMDGKGMTLNTVSLAGLAIGIGKLVDGAIVVQENISRRRNNGMDKSAGENAVEGANEVFAAVTGSVLTTVAVFLPLIFVAGIVGQVFKDLSLSVVFSQMASLVVAFTLVPMLASKFALKEDPSPAPFVQNIRDKAGKWVDRYNRLLDYTLVHPGKVVLTTTIACLVSILILAFMPRAVFPRVEGSQIFIRLDMPMGTRLEVTDRMARKMETTLSEIKDIESQSVIVGSLPQEGLQPLGSHQAQIVLHLGKRRKKSAAALAATLKKTFKDMDLGGGRLFFFEQGGTFSFLGSQGAPIVIEVKGHDLRKLEGVARGIADKLKELPGLNNARAGISEPAPELQLEIRRDALADLSLSVSELSETVLSAIRGKVVSKFHDQGKEVDIRVRLRPEDRRDARAVERLYIHSPLDIDVPLSAVASIQNGQGPSEIVRYDQQRTVLVLADLSGRSAADAAARIQPILDDLRRDEGISVALTGESTRMSESFKSLQIVLVLSILFVFMIMAAEFESLWKPLLILLTIPLALIGMALGLLLTGQPLTAMAAMGLVFLGGIVVDNGIVLIDFVNRRLDEKMPLKEALRAGCLTRLRPILMTAVCTILGMLPLALGIGEGSDMQQPMAIVMVFGLFVSTLLTLVEIPALFVLMQENVFNPEGRRLRIDAFKEKFQAMKQKALGRP